MSVIKPHAFIMQAPVYVAGEAKVPGVENPAKLSSNESPLGPSPLAIEAYHRAASNLARYPDGSATDLRQAIAACYQLNPEQLICSNGSEQLIDMITRAFVGPGDEVIFTEYAFIAYRIAAQIAGALPVAVAEREFATDVDAVLQAVTPRTRIVFLANPNNPTGTYISSREVQRLRAGLREDILLVVDAAYCEYVQQTDYTDAHELVNHVAGNTVVLHTFSKIYGLAALRVGWAYCCEDVVKVLTRMRGVFNVSSPAQAAAVAAVRDVGHVEQARTHNRLWLDWLMRNCSRIGLKFSPGVGNFLLLHFRDAEQSKVADHHLRSHGIILRPVASYSLPQCLRASVGVEHENRKLIELLHAAMSL